MRIFTSFQIWTTLVLFTLTKVTGRVQFLASPSIAATPFLPDVITLRGGSTSWSSSPFGARSASLVAPPQQTSSNREVTKEETKEVMDAFLTRDSRQSFIARVYAILSCQLAVTALSVVMFGTQPALTEWMQRPGLGTYVPLVSLILSTIAWFTMCASPEARRKSPLKWKLLVLFTIGEAISVGFISSFYEFQSVMSAMMATTIATLSVSLYTANQKNPKYDLSQWGSGLSSCGLIFLVYGLLHVFQTFGVLPPGFLPYNNMMYGLAGACLFSFYLAYHTRLIIAGKHAKYQMNETDYVFGAMTLYNDIINIFIYMLRLIGEDKQR